METPPAPGGAPPGAPPPPPAPPPAPGGAPPPPVPPPAPPGSGASVTMSSEQLALRLQETREATTRAFLKEHGLEKPEDLAARLKRLSDLETAGLSETDRLKKQVEELSPKVAKGQSDAELLKSLVDEQFSQLPAATQKIIDDTAKGDPQRRLELMRLAKSMGTGTPPAPPAPPGPTTTAPGAPPPPAGTVTKFQEWEAMQKRSPLMGDIFYQNNKREIERTRPAS